MRILIFIIIFAIIIICICYNEKKTNTVLPSEKHKHIIKSTPRRIEECVSSEDVQYQMSYETQRVIATVEASRETIKNAIAMANKEVDVAWLNSYEKVIKISSNLDKNLRYHARNNLEYSKFQYYASLHFRSMIAADIVYREFCKIDASFKEINELIVSIAKTRKSMSLSKAQIFSAKDALKELRKVFLDRVHELNKETAILRDKIGDECGEKGRRWKEERMRNRG